MAFQYFGQVEGGQDACRVQRDFLLVLFYSARRVADGPVNETLGEVRSPAVRVKLERFMDFLSRLFQLILRLIRPSQQ